MAVMMTLTAVNVETLRHSSQTNQMSTLTAEVHKISVKAIQKSTANRPTKLQREVKYGQPKMWANAQRDGRPGEYRRRPLFNAAKFG